MTSTASPPAPPPAAQGYRMPAEWAPHQGTWFSWPHNPDTWPGVLGAAERALAGAVAALGEGERVHVNVLDAAHERHVAGLLAAAGAGADRLRLHRQPTNDAWCRDHGAIFVTRPGEAAPLLALDFGYNAWGGKYPPFDLDDAMPRHMAAHLGVPHRTVDMILEGGSIEVNGAGTLLTTEQCLLNPNRNPGLSRADIERRLRENLGVSQILWLGDGIVGDDTDGHIDDLTRFVAADTVVTVVEADPVDPNFAPLRENRARLAAMRLPDGRPLQVIELPMPAPLERNGERLPASYANFYIGNRVVLLPVFGCPQDAEAGATLARCFPGRRVVPVDCRDIVVGLGTLMQSRGQMGKISEFVHHHYRHFNAAALIDAADAYVRHLDQGGRMLVTLAGAMSTAELGLSLAEMIRRDKVHAICCTGANLEEDIFNLVAHDHYVRIPHYRELSARDEEALLARHLNRVTDTCIPEEEAIRRLEKAVLDEWVNADRQGEAYFPHEFFYRILRSGKLEQHYQIDPQGSWMLAACEKNLPIIVPGWEDSTLGNIFASHCISGDIGNVHTVRTGIEYMMELAKWYQGTCRSHSIGFFQIGGGIAGDFPICVVPMLEQDLQVEDIPRWGYFCQISDSTTSYGSYSGAVPNEKITWGKLAADTPKFIIESDATIVAPLIFACVLDQ